MEFAAHPTCVTSVGISSAGFLASSSDDNTVCIWSLPTILYNSPYSPATSIKRFIGHTKMVTSIRWSLSGMFLISGSWDNTIRKWNAVSGECLFVTKAKHVDGIREIAYSPDNRRIVSGGSDKKMYVWDAESGSVIIGPLEGHTSIVTAVTYSPRGEYILSGSGDRSVIVWDADNGSKLLGPFGRTLQLGHINLVPSV